VAAADERLGGHPLTDFPLAAQASADLDHLARELVAHDGLGLERTPPGAAVPALRPVQIGAADAAGAHLEDQVGRSGPWLGQILDHQRRAGRLEHGRLHRIVSARSWTPDVARG
jgi:hypothetical protein